MALSGRITVGPFGLLTQLDDLATVCRDMKWPFIVERVLGAETVNTFILDSPEQFKEFLTSPSSDVLRSCRTPLIVEEVIDYEREFHCEGVRYERRM